jgi:FkbM family methyltransferase
MVARALGNLRRKLANRHCPNHTMSCEVVRQLGFFSQHGQDKFVAELTGNRRGGFFVDVGANDGITFSNSYYFEHFLGWQGIAIEPHPRVFQQLTSCRRCDTVAACVAAKEGEVEFLQIEGADMLSGMVDQYDAAHVARVQRTLRKTGGTSQLIKVPATTLNSLLKQRGITQVDYLSLDTEGGELDIVQSIDFDQFQIDCIGIENNLKNLKPRRVMEALGYQLVAIIGCDEMFVRKSAATLAA